MNRSTIKLCRTPLRSVLRALAAGTGLLAIHTATAGTGAWNADSDGLWSNAANWLGGVPTAAGDTANLTLAITAPRTITNDATNTVGVLNLGASGTPAFGYTLAGAANAALILNNSGLGAQINQTDGTTAADLISTPLILADKLLVTNNSTLTLSAVINGGNLALTKAGPGTLNLTWANLYTNAITVSGGTLAANSLTFASGKTLSIAAGATVASAGSLFLNANGSSLMTGVSGAGTLQLTGTANGPAAPDIYFCANDVDNSSANYGTKIGTAVNLGSVQRYIWGKSNHNGVGQYGVTAADCQFGTNIYGAGGLTFIAQDAFTSGSSPMEVGFCLNASNSFTGPVIIQRGSVYQGAAGAFPAGNGLQFNVAAGNNGKFFLYGLNTAVTDLSSTGAGTAWVANGNGNPSFAGPATLTVTQNNSATFAGNLVDVNKEYGVKSGSLATTLALVKTGPATLTLGGQNTYSGPTTVSNGTLALGAGSLLASPLTVQTGASLAIGSPTVATAVLSNSLTFAPGSTSFMRLSKNGGVPASDQFTNLTAVNYGGTLIVSNITTDGTPLALGDVFQLFACPSSLFTGAFTSSNLPALPAGLAWDLSQLAANGAIAVVIPGTVSTPIFSPVGGGYNSAVTVTMKSFTAGATIYYTTDGSTPTPSSPHGVTPVTVSLLTSTTNNILSAYAALAGFTTSATNSANYYLAESVWTNTLSGNWSGQTNWYLGFVGNSAGLTADFSTLKLNGDTTVTNDLAPTIGGLIFADKGAGHNWIVADGSAGAITLDNAGLAPVITVSNQTATIATPLDGTSGLVKAGKGTLNLTGANTYTGNTVASAGTLGIGSLTTDVADTLNVAAGATVVSTGTLALNAGGSNPSIDVSGTGTIQLPGNGMGTNAPDIFFAANDVDGSTANWGTRLGASVYLAPGQHLIWGKSNHNGVGQYGVTSADAQFAGSVSGPGGLTILGLDNFANMEVGFCLNASNSFTGPLEIQRGSVYQGATSGFPNGSILRFNVAAGNAGKFFLYGHNSAVTDLSSTGAGTAYVANGNANPSAYGPVTLTVTQNNAATYAGNLLDTTPEYGVTAGTLATTLSLVKAGSATLTLAGPTTYSGSTTVAAGKLVVNSSKTGAGNLTINDGAALGVLVAGGSQLTPATFTAGSSNGPATVEFTGLASLTTPPIQAGTLVVNGTTVLNLLNGTFAAGGVYPLIGFTTINGAGNFVLGTVPANLVATIVTNNNTIALSVTGGNVLTWNGLVNGTWDIGTSANWTLNGVTGNKYSDGAPVVFGDTGTGTTTVNVSTPVSPVSVTVNNTSKTYTIGGSPVAGNATLIKNGTGALNLTGANTFTGNLAIGAGTLTIGGAGELGGGFYPGTITNNGSLVYNSSVDQTNTGTLGGSGTLTQNGPDTLTLAANAPLTGGIKVNGGTLRLTTSDFGGQFTPSLITINPNGTLLNDHTHALGAGTVLAINGGTWLLNYEDYKTNITMVDGQINYGGNGDGGELRWGPSGSAGNSTLLVTNSVVGSVINDNLNLITGGNLLTINTARGLAASDLTINGSIINGGGILKTGNGTLTLNGGDTYTGPTTVAAGTLALGSSASLASPVTVQSGAKLVIGATNLATVTINNALTLAAGSTNYLRISKTGGTIAADGFAGLTTVTYGGTLIVSNLTSDGTALAVGDAFQLYAAGTAGYAGSFASYSLPVLPAGLSWDVSQLLVSGSIAVVSTVSTPTFNPPGAGFVGPVTVTISSLTPGATIYYTTDGSTPTTSSPHGVTPVTVTVLAGSPAETLSAYGTLAGHADSTVNTAGYTLTSSTYTNLAGGNFSDPNSWLYAQVPNAAGLTADFSTLKLMADTTVTNDSAPTLGNLVFADQGSAHNWIVADNNAGPITLDNAGNTPVITVSNQTATIQTPLDGTSGFTKAGNGTLNASLATTFTGNTTVAAGTLGLSAVTFAAGSTLTIAAGATFAPSGTVAINADGSINPVIGVGGAGTLLLNSPANGPASPDIYFCANDVDNTSANWGTRVGTPVVLGAGQHYIWGKSNHNGVGQYGLTSADCQFGGSISGAGGLVIAAQDDAETRSPAMEVGFCLNASNSFTGPLEIQRGAVYEGAPGAFPAGDILRFNVAAGYFGKFFLYGQNTAVSDLSATGAGTVYIANGNGNPSAYGPVTLTVTQNNSATFAGSILDASAEYGVTAGNQATILSLVKLGPATLTLAGANNYSGPTAISNGTLVVNGSLSSPVKVAAGGTLAGLGTLGGATVVQAGGTLTPGNGGLGTLTISNALTLAAGSSTTLAINRATGNYGSVAATSTVYGGTLTVTSLGGAFQVGDSFQLFSGGGTGNFTAMNLPAISPLKWSWNPAAGTLSVVPAVNPAPAPLAAQAVAGRLNLAWPADHTGWRLQVQTNHLAAGISSNPADWGTVAGSTATNAVSLPVDATKPTEFYRLVYP